MMRKILMVAMLAAAPALAHDFWLQPRGYRFPAGAAVPFTVLVGHGRFREPWAVKLDRILLFKSYGPDGVRDRRSDMTPQPHGDAGLLRVARPGTYVVAFQNGSVLSDLPALRFNDYAREEGLTPALETRAAAGTSDRNGRELYSRRAKMLVRVGDPPANERSFVTQRLGLQLEIVPEKDPYRLAPNERLPVRIFYDGRPLAGALVKLTNLEFDAKPFATQRSDGSGRAAFAVPRTGSWLINVIWTRPIKDRRAEFQTIFSSLTFGFTPGRAGV